MAVRKVKLYNWAFAQIPRSGSNKVIIALLGTLEDGRFLAGSGHIKTVLDNRVAVSESGTQYILMDADHSDQKAAMDELSDAVEDNK